MKSSRAAFLGGAIQQHERCGAGVDRTAGFTLVTGGAGFVGSHLVAGLAAAGHHVRVMELPGVTTDHLAPSAAEVVRGDIRSMCDVRRAVRDCGTVYHVAGNPNLWTMRRGDLLDVNYVGARNVLQVAVEQGVCCIVHTSTESILSDVDRHRPLDDNSPVELRHVVGTYGRSKAKAARFALSLAKAGHPVYVACPTMPVGPGDWGISPPTRLIADFCNGRLPAFLECRLNFVDVRDVAEAMIRLPQTARIGHQYLLGGHNVRLSELLARLGRLVNMPPPRWQIPYAVALGVGLIGECVAAVLTRRQPPATVAGVKLARRNLHVAEGQTVARFGVKLRSIDDSLTDAIASLAQRGLVPPSW